MIFSFFIFLIAAKTSYAVKFDLIAPSGTLTSGQNVQFTINVDTQEESMTSTSVGMTYETQYLQYVSAVAGDTFTTISTDVQDGGKLVLTGTSTDGFSGTGSFAVVTFKLIAKSPGSTELCALYNPGTTPTPATTTSTPGPTSATVPTALPTTGVTGSTTKGIVIGLGFIVASAAGLFILKKI